MLDGKLVPPKQALSVMLDHCARADDFKPAASLKELSQESKVGLPGNAYESLFKLYSKVRNLCGKECGTYQRSRLWIWSRIRCCVAAS